MFTSYIVDNDRLFQDALNRARAVTDDLRIPLTLISKDFYKSEKAIFQLGGPGKYKDLADSTKRQKEKAGFPIYPILKRKGRLAGSVTDPGHADAINRILNKTTLIIGTKVPYGVFHQSDKPRKKIPLRKFLFIGPEAPRFATSDQMGRTERWLNIMNEFVLQKGQEALD